MKDKTEPLSLKQSCRNMAKQLRGYFKQQRKAPWVHDIRKPWVLLFGTQHAGKTQLLNHLAACSPHGVKKTPWFDWYTHSTSVLIDIPMSRISGDSANWHDFVGEFNKQHGKPALDHIIWVLDFPSLVKNTDSDWETYSQRWKTLLEPLQYKKQPISITLMISHSDRISGFKEFFADLDHDRRDQSFGFSLEQPFRDSFSEKITAFIKRINDQLIWRLHHERHVDKRAAIENFPLQMLSVTEQLELCLQKIAWPSHCQINGVYFVSNCQEQPSIDLLSNTLQQQFTWLNTEKESIIQQSRPYFIDGAFDCIQQQATQFADRLHAKQWRYWLIYPVAAVFIIGLTWLWQDTYQKDRETLSLLQSTLLHSKPNKRITNQATDSITTAPWFKKITQLSQAIHVLDHSPAHHRAWSGLTQINDLKDLSVQHYREILTSSFKHYALSLLTTHIKQGIAGNKMDLYNSLKIYLMLTDKTHYQRTAIKRWFAKIWSKQYDNNTQLQQSLNQYLSQLLNLNSTIHWQLDTHLVNQARTALTALPLADRVFLALQNNQIPQKQPISQHLQKLTAIETSSLSVPVFYSPAEFQAIYYQRIPALVATLAHGDWVMGKLDQKLSDKQRTQVISTVRQLYSRFYSQTWFALLKKIQFKSANTIIDLQQQLALLTNPQSPLLSLLNHILGQITLRSFHKIPGQISPPQQKSITIIKHYLNHQAIYTTLQAKLSALQNYLNRIHQSQHAGMLAYKLSAQHFGNPDKSNPIADLSVIAQQLPAPLNKWATHFNHNSEQLLLHKTQQYISRMWQTIVWSYYEQNIANHYPIKKNASQSISFPAFKQFFGPQGMMGQFFQNYLQPFVDMRTHYWTWKKIDGQSLPVSQQFLDAFIRASMIQQMFFSHDHSQSGFQFQLKLINLSSNVSKVQLTFGSKPLTWQAGQQAVIALHWPEPNTHAVQLIMTNRNGEVKNSLRTGPWSWFRLLDSATVQATSDAKRYIITFKLGSMTARFDLHMDQMINPLIPGILSHFQCKPRANPRTH